MPCFPALQQGKAFCSRRHPPPRRGHIPPLCGRQRQRLRAEAWAQGCLLPRIPLLLLAFVLPLLFLCSFRGAHGSLLDTPPLAVRCLPIPFALLLFCEVPIPMLMPSATTWRCLRRDGRDVGGEGAPPPNPPSNRNHPRCNCEDTASQTMRLLKKFFFFVALARGCSSPRSPLDRSPLQTRTVFPFWLLYCFMGRSSPSSGRLKGGKGCWNGGVTCSKTAACR